MTRATKRTIRRMKSPMARDLLRLANDADSLSRRARRMAEKAKDWVAADRLRWDPAAEKFYVED